MTRDGRKPRHICTKLSAGRNEWETHTLLFLLAENLAPDMQCDFNQKPGFSHVSRDEITQHLEKYELIKTYLPSFIKRKSCLTNLAEFVLGANVKNRQGWSSGANPHRFQKSHLNTARDGRLIRKVSKYGIKTIVLERLRKWLGD